MNFRTLTFELQQDFHICFLFRSATSEYFSTVLTKLLGMAEKKNKNSIDLTCSRTVTLDETPSEEAIHNRVEGGLVGAGGDDGNTHPHTTYKKHRVIFFIILCVSV